MYKIIFKYNNWRKNHHLKKIYKILLAKFKKIRNNDTHQITQNYLMSEIFFLTYFLICRLKNILMKD